MELGNMWSVNEASTIPNSIPDCCQQEISPVLHIGDIGWGWLCCSHSRLLWSCSR